MKSFKQLVEELVTEKYTGDLKVYEVGIRNNYYAGKYYEVGVRKYPVLAKNEKEAKDVVLKNSDEILKDLMSKKMSGKPLLSKKSLLPITEKNITIVEEGTKRLKRSTLGKYGTFFSPDGKIEAKLNNGVVEEVKE